MKYLTDINITTLRTDQLHNGYVDGININTDLNNDYKPTVGICLYGTDDMAHGTYKRGFTSTIPPNHLDHNRSDSSNAVFSPSNTGIECESDSLAGKILISTNLDAAGDETDPVRWCELATVKDIPPLMDVIIPVPCEPEIHEVPGLVFLVPIK